MGKVCLGCNVSIPDGKRKYCTTACGKKYRYHLDPSYYKSYSLSHREERSDYNRGYFKDNPDKKALYNKRYYGKSYESNKPTYYANVAKRRAAKLGATPAWLSEDQKQQIKDFYWLARDLKSVTGDTYHVDHILPLQGKDVCGLHVPWNLQVLPADMNLSKNNSSLDNWEVA